MTEILFDVNFDARSTESIQSLELEMVDLLHGVGVTNQRVVLHDSFAVT